MKKMLTIDDVREILCLSSRTINRYVKEGKLTSYKIGGARRFKEDDIEVFIGKYIFKGQQREP